MQRQFKNEKRTLRFAGNVYHEMLYHKKKKQPRGSLVKKCLDIIVILTIQIDRNKNVSKTFRKSYTRLSFECC